MIRSKAMIVSPGGRQGLSKRAGHEQAANCCEKLARRRLTCAGASTAASASDVQGLKQQLVKQAGTKGGLDMSQAAKAPVVDLLQEISEFDSDRENVDLTGTTWNLLFTNSTSTSAGKFGPLTAKTQQVFPRDQPGTYINSAELFGGLLRLELFGTYERGRNHRLELIFKNVKAFFAQLPVTKRAFPDNFSAFWRVMYADKELRVFETNKGNYFAMYNVDGRGTVYNAWSRYDANKFS